MGTATSVVTRSSTVTTRDGAQLATEITVADDGERHPVLLVRTPYGCSSLRAAHDPVALAREGWAVVFQDVRGRWDSTGECRIFHQEIDDGAETVEWSARQPWSNGQVAMTGASYNGATQYLAAIRRPQGLGAISPLISAADFRDRWSYEGGAFNLGFVTAWALALAGSGSHAAAGEEQLAAELSSKWDEIVRQSPASGDVAKVFPDFARWADADDQAYWEPIDLRARVASIDLPAFHVSGWYDIFCEGSLDAYTSLSEHAASEYARRSQRLVVGPWTHTSLYLPWTPYADFGPEAHGFARGIPQEQLDFLAGALERRDVASGVSLFVMGRNRWIECPSWPPPTTEHSLYLDADRAANGLSGDGHLALEVPAATGVDRYQHDPSDPVPCLGGRILNGSLPGAGPMDQRPVEGRSDVLVYTGSALERELTVVGPVTAEIFLASSAGRADLVVKLVDVHPDAKAVNIVSGVRRVPLTPGRVERVAVDVGSTAATFRAGHRVRVEVASSCFPQYDCCEKAEQSVHRGARAASRVVLPRYEPEG